MNVPFNYGGFDPKFSNYKAARIVILPIPYDGTSTWGKGADKGPRALIDASRNMELYDIETKSEPYKNIIYTEKEILAKTPESMVDKGYKKTKELLKDKKFVVTIGGEHSISMGPMKAHAEFFKDISILHLDAHTDMRPEYEGTPFNHACAMARGIESAKNVVSIGIRSMDFKEFDNIKKMRKLGRGHDIFFAENIYNNTKWERDALNLLHKKVYISIDLDVFDPSILPSTGTPEPGGMQWYPILAFLKKVFSEREVVGFDIVELAPNKNEKSSDFLAAKLVYKMLAYKFNSK